MVAWSNRTFDGCANVIAWLPLLIVKLWLIWVAAFQLALPAWFALIVHVAAAPLTNVTVVPETVQTPVVDDVNTTANPDDAVALTVNGP